MSNYHKLIIHLNEQLSEHISGEKKEENHLNGDTIHKINYKAHKLVTLLYSYELYYFHLDHSLVYPDRIIIRRHMFTHLFLCCYLNYLFHSGALFGLDETKSAE